MTENKRFKAHIFDDGVNERYHDGIIDNENDENVIRNYQYISRLLNELNDKNKFLSDFRGFITMEHQKIKEENKQLKSELSRYKEVNRLDIWKSSYSSEDALITELQDKCDKKQEHIVVLENKIRRMREAIHKLEWLATHRNGELIRENEELKDALNQRTDQCDKYYKENEQLKKENERLTDKLNKTALELVDECISQGKAVEISEMSYSEFLDYRAKNEKSMELQL